MQNVCWTPNFTMAAGKARENRGRSGQFLPLAACGPRKGGQGGWQESNPYSARTLTPALHGVFSTREHPPAGTIHLIRTRTASHLRKKEFVHRREPVRWWVRASRT